MVWGCLELQFLSTRMNSVDYITVLSCSLLPFLRENNDKNMSSNRTMIEFTSADRVWNGFVTNLLRFYRDMNIIENVFRILIRRVYTIYQCCKILN